MTQPTAARPSSDPWEIVDASFAAAAGPGSSLPDHGLEIAFAGRSNVGKSSLINALTGRRALARAGATPGVTRGLVQFAARTRSGDAFALVDLPGYGFAQRSKAERRSWADLIERYLRERAALAAVVLLLDARRGIGEDDLALLEYLAPAGGPPPGGAAAGPGARRAPEVILVATKIDKVGRSAQQAAAASLAASLRASPETCARVWPGEVPRPIAWSSVTGQGKSELGRRIALALERARARR